MAGPALPASTRGKTYSSTSPLAHATAQKMSIGSAVSVGKCPIHCTQAAPISCCRNPIRLEATPACCGARLTAVAVTFGSARPWPKDSTPIGTKIHSGCVNPNATKPSAAAAPTTVSSTPTTTIQCRSWVAINRLTDQLPKK